ncbi:hypothetical protein CANCADRAFT_73201 [Tortispora caseinolytica NRRL Y-17796]|uniref:Vacuolar protein sorting-associated protein 29 n=1 Tax=Tortispora caseinolytica NRRL Y-17796 TaxID=767744 RepID=A0A1E4TIL4_9ASCO|nr:hypothetical protein CANCADRAFT_73201 [Tortispora caseinolytica NRRL Y-17796]
MLVLALGDAHIPDRAIDIPEQFQKLLKPGRIGLTLCLGNLTDKATFEYIRGIAPQLEIVRGDYDLMSGLPQTKVVATGSLRIGITHGHNIIPRGDADALLILARQLDVNVLLFGGTHKFEAYELDGKFFLNPGSVTGAYSTEKPTDSPGIETVPSFCLLDIQGTELVLYVYSLVDGQLKVERIKYRKD